MGNWLKGRVLINDVTLISDSTQQGSQVTSSPQNYQVSFKKALYCFTLFLFIFIYI